MSHLHTLQARETDIRKALAKVRGARTSLACVGLTPSTQRATADLTRTEKELEAMLLELRRAIRLHQHEAHPS